MSLESQVYDLTVSSNDLTTVVKNKLTNMNALVAVSAGADKASLANANLASASNTSLQTLVAGTSTAATQAKNAADQAVQTAVVANEILAAQSQTLHSGSVVKMFAYDTTKDSDGGAWTKRCQDKSWYTETLGGTKWIGQAATVAAAWATTGSGVGSVYQNTTNKLFYSLVGTNSNIEVFRGITREFPATSMVVIEPSRVVIYDTSIAGCPMWMVLRDTVHFWDAQFATGAVIQGKLFLGNRTAISSWSGTGLYTIDFVENSLTCNVLQSQNTYYSEGTTYNINSYTGLTTNYRGVGIGTRRLINYSINDIAVTVLDSAPTNPTTGLKVPTIAIVTLGGISVIKDDGTVVNSSQLNDTKYCSIKGATLYLSAKYGATATVRIQDLTNIQASWTPSELPVVTRDTYLVTPTKDILATFNSLGINGLSFYMINRSALSKTLKADITNIFNTGWQLGDSRLTTLSDTIAETITGSGELVTNGTFDTDTSGWGVDPGGALSVSNGRLRNTCNGTGYSSCSYTFQTIVGKTYVASADVYSPLGDTSPQFQIGSTTSPFLYATGVVLGAGIKYSFVATTANTLITFAVGTATNGKYSEYDNVSCKLAEPDRSVKNKGLILNGTLTKSAVATGANLMAYSGFSATNYLEQPYSSDLDFGTGDFSVIMWVKIVSIAGETFFNRALKGSPGGLFLLSGGSGDVSLYASTNTSYIQVASVPVGVLPSSGWSLLAVQRTSGTITLSINGVVNTSVAFSTNLTYPDAITRIGVRTDGTFPVTTNSIALFRMSTTGFTADQIAHIYRTELPLFQPGAQCTLGGTVSFASGISYDDSTELLHIVNSWGRSSFKDIVRVDSEQTAVGALTSVSVSNGTISVGSSTSATLYNPADPIRLELTEKVAEAKATGKIPVSFEYDAIAAQTAFIIPKGYSAKVVYSAEVMKREGATKAYTRSFDGFNETINFNVAPGAGVWVSILCVRSN